MDELLTPAKVMEILHISRSTLWKLIKAGRLPRVLLGTRTMRFRREAVEALMRGENEPTP